MEYRRLGRSGLKVSAVGLGCNNIGARLDLAATRALVAAARDAGVTLFDTADLYGGGASEAILGEALEGARDEVVIATKFGWALDDTGRHQGGSRRWIMQSVEASLRRLRTDRIDLYQFHRPDPDTPLEETVRAMEDLVRQGKVLYLGLSNIPAWAAVEADWLARGIGGAGFVSCQNELSLAIRKGMDELLPMLSAKGMGLLPFYPLSAGLLTGKYRRDVAPDAGSRLAAPGGAVHLRHVSDATWDTVERLRAWCEGAGWTMTDLAFAWLLDKPQVSSVIAGATSPAQIAQNAAAGSRRLSAEERTAVDALLAAPD